VTKTSARARVCAGAAVAAAIASTFLGSAAAYASSSARATPKTTTYHSLHWVGYTFPVSHVTGVRAQWTEPRVTGKKGDEEFVWLGIGGWNQADNNIIQDGTFTYFPGGGLRNEGVWDELVPNEEAKFPGVPVGPGDHIYSSITLVSARNNKWHMYLHDLTSGATFSKTVKFKSLESYPSFVVEDPNKGKPSPTGPFYPFPRWKSVTFTHIGVRIRNRWVGAASLTRYRVNMVRGRKTYAAAGSLSRKSAFTATQR
jgi:hypothetical protein